MKQECRNLAVLIAALVMAPCYGKEEVITPDLRKIVAGDGWGILNREAKVVEQDNRVEVQFDGRPGMGGACLETLDFSNGIIECDIKGKPQAPSYIGIAFDVIDTVSYDAVYFRPFNFRNEARKQHSVQYISHPKHTWQKLRESSPGTYEAAIAPAPDPNDFFHVKLVVTRPKVHVYVNHAKQPCLTVDLLSPRSIGRIALFMDNESEGVFANLKIMPQDKPVAGTDGSDSSGNDGQ